MIKTSGKSGRQVSREIGRSDTFVSASMAQGACPRMDTFVKIASVCGYQVVAVPLAEENKGDSLRSPITLEYSGRKEDPAS